MKDITEITKFGAFTINTSVDRTKEGIYGIAFCPICGRKEESHDHAYGESHALIISASKIRTHMQMAHGMKEEPVKIEQE